MRIKIIETSRNFQKQYKKTSRRIKTTAKEKESIFRQNPFDPRLDTHKLQGKEKEAWAFSVTRSYRIKFIFLTEDSVLFLEIGTHDIYK